MEVKHDLLQSQQEVAPLLPWLLRKLLRLEDMPPLRRQLRHQRGQKQSGQSEVH